MGYYQDEERLANLAYFCLTVLEDLAVQPPRKASTNRKPSSKRKKTAEKYEIELEVLTKIGHLSSKKGGPRGARKAEGKNNNFTAEDRCFLENALKAVIRRAAGESS